MVTFTLTFKSCFIKQDLNVKVKVATQLRRLQMSYKQLSLVERHYFDLGPAITRDIYCLI